MNSKKLTTALLVASAAFPASASALPRYDDLRSPDARDAAIQAERAAYQDLRNPDTRGDAIAAERAGYQDLRNPDTRGDAIAAERGIKPVTVARVDRAGASDGFDWGDAGIGASAMLGLLAVAGGAFVVAGGQRRRLA